MLVLQSRMVTVDLEEIDTPNPELVWILMNNDLTYLLTTITFKCFGGHGRGRVRLLWADREVRSEMDTEVYLGKENIYYL